jgi:hypothetical protein
MLQWFLLNDAGGRNVITNQVARAAQSLPINARKGQSRAPNFPQNPGARPPPMSELALQSGSREPFCPRRSNLKADIRRRKDNVITGHKETNALQQGGLSGNAGL